MTAFLDLFAGIGGFALGTEWAGLHFDHHYYSEIDAYAQRVYALRFPDAISLGDIRNIRGADLPEGDWIIAGGFPCQDISVAGKGLGLAGERSGLWFEYARIIGELRPRFAIMENVGALAFRGLDSVLGSLASIGYDAEWQDIRASDVGAPHRRERLWIVAYPGGSGSRGTRSGAETRFARARSSSALPPFMADAASIYVQGFDRRSGEIESGRSSWWATEPDVGRSFDGFPDWLDRYVAVGCSYEENFRRIKTLRKLWEAHVSQTLRRAIGGLDRLQQADLLFAFLRQYESGSDEARLLMEGEEASETFLRSLRGDALFARSSYRPGQEEQFAAKYPNALQILPRLLAFDSPPYWSGGGWEDATPRIANKVPARVDRLKCLGNSIVPQISELIFRQAAFDELRAT